MRGRDKPQVATSRGHRRIESAARNRADRESAHHHRKANRQAVKRIPGGRLGRGDVENDVSEREGEKKFRKDHLSQDIRGRRRTRQIIGPLQVIGRARSHERTGELREKVGGNLRSSHASAYRHRDGDRRIIMPARDVAARINHHHQHGADGQRRDHSRIRIDHTHADRKDEEEGADELNDEFFHRGYSEVLTMVA